MKLLTQPVQPPGVTEVELMVGAERRHLRICRPIRFDELSLVMVDGETARSDHYGRISARAIAKRLINAAPARNVDGYVMDTRTFEPNNVAHLIMEVIPLCLLARSALGSSPLFLFRPLLPRFRELLWHFGIDAWSTYRTIRGAELKPFLSRELAQYPIEGAVPDCPLLELVGDIYGSVLDRRNDEGSERLFLARRGPRGLINGREVTALLESLGYRTVYLEDMTIAEQIRTVLSAQDFVCVHGAAMGYLGLKSRIRSVVELLPTNVYHNYFVVALGAKTERYVQLLDSFDDEVQFGNWNQILKWKQRKFAADLRQLEMAITESSTKISTATVL